MPKYAVLDNTTGAAGTVRNVCEALSPINAGWIDLAGQPNEVTMGWQWDGVSVFSYGPPPGEEALLTEFTNVEVDSTPVPEGNMSVTTAQTVTIDIQLTDKATGLPSTFSGDLPVVVKGLYGTTPIVFDLTYTSGAAQVVTTLSTPGVYLIDDDSFSLGIIDPTLKSNFDQEIIIVVSAP